MDKGKHIGKRPILLRVQENRCSILDSRPQEGNYFYWREELTTRGVNYSTGGMLETNLDANYFTVE